MTYDHELILIGSRPAGMDSIGNPVTEKVETAVLCGLRSVGRNEFYGAAAAGLRPEITFVVHGYEYNGEQSVRWEGRTYKVLRTYAVGMEETELTCERVVNSGQHQN